MFRRVALPVLFAAAGIAALAANVAEPVATPGPGEISGPARVIDGDTLDVGGIRVRLYGVDAPERDQTCRSAQGVPWPCGTWSSERVTALYGGRRLVCARKDIDHHGRTVAVCRAEGADIAARLVSEGVIAAYPRYTRDYVALEAAAKAAGRGLWAGTMQSPEAFRHAGRTVPGAAPTGCAIKGNISDRGRIYHLPGNENYAKTRINTARGERWFCSEAEARAAGWRAARR